MSSVQGATGWVRLDDDFASPLQFALMAALQDGAKLEFRTLRRILDCEGAPLRGAIAQLEKEGHLVARRVSFGDVPGLWISASARGHDAFEGHIAALTEIAGGGQTS